PERSGRSADRLGLYLRRDLSERGQRRGARHAAMRHRGDESPSCRDRHPNPAQEARRLLLDQAGWHLSGRLKVPSNITLIALPAKCPELNPQENIWQFIRDNWLSNRVFKSYDDIVDHCCYAWNKLIDQPWKIMSIGIRHWAYPF